MKANSGPFCGIPIDVTSSLRSNAKGLLLLLAWLLGSGQGTGAANPLVIGNDRFELSAVSSENRWQVLVQRRDIHFQSRIEPVVRIIYSEKDPRYGMAALNEEVSRVAGWKNSGGERQEANLFQAFASQPLQAVQARLEGEQLVFEFPPQPFGSFQLRIALPAGRETPVLETVLQARASGWFSAAFTGIESKDAPRLDFLYQPLVWSWKRFPAGSWLTPEAFAPTAAVFINTLGATEGLAVDPSEIPYRFAKFENSRFGFVLRDEGGAARPMIFAPVPGGAESRLEPGDVRRFRVRYWCEPGDWQRGLEFLYGDVLHYRNERQNATVSLTDTLLNMIQFAMDDRLGGWVEELKGFDYQFDVPGTVKVVSALHPLSAALVTGDEQIYRRRALPVMEYVMSREKYLYAVNDKITAQAPSHFMRGPCVEVGELAGLNELTGGWTQAFQREAERVFNLPRALNLKTRTGGANWQDWLAMFRFTGHAEALAKARQGADQYLRERVENYPSHFGSGAALQDKQAAFYTDYQPRWFDLMELYQATGDRRYLEAATLGARATLLWLRSNPMAPPASLLVNPGGKVPGVFSWRRSSADRMETMDTTTEIPEQIVPAWRTSLVGLPPEQGYTYMNGPIMLTHHAAWMLRLAHWQKDDLLRDAARNGVLGRYANFPGYYFTSLETTVYQHPAYPLKPYRDIKYNAIFYNHVWPHIALLMDFLVADAFYRSGGAVDFPSAYAPGYAYLASKVYGHRPGQIFGHAAELWLPRQGVQVSDHRLNYFLGLGEEDLYVVLCNTTDHTVKTEVYLQPDVLLWAEGKTYPVEWLGIETRPIGAAMKEGRFDVSITAQGLAVARIVGLRSRKSWRPEPNPGRPSGKTFAQLETGDDAAGIVTAMLFRVQPRHTDAYIYTSLTEKSVSAVTLRYRFESGEWKQARDVAYPFEFSLALPRPEDRLEFELVIEPLAGSPIQSPRLSLCAAPDSGESLNRKEQP